MKTISICVTAVLVVALITIPFEIAPDGQRPDTQGFINLVLIGAVVFGMTLTYRYLTTRKRSRAKLIDEYHRLADMAITAQEHTDLRLEDLRVQLESLRKAIKGRIPVGVTLTGLQAGGCGTNRNASAVVLVSA